MVHLRKLTTKGSYEVDLLLTKAEIAEKDKDACGKFIINTIYTTQGRNDFADWMKKAYKNCTNNNK